MGNKAIIVGLISGIAAVSVAFAVYASGNNASSDAAQARQQLLFVQTAASGSLVEGDDGQYVLTLNNVSPKTIYFTDRPHRMTGTFGQASLFIDSNDFPQQYCNYYCPDGSRAP